MAAFHAEAVALAAAATAFRDRAARLAAFRRRFRRRLSAEKRADILAAASALEAAAAELRAVAAEQESTDPIAALVAQARALGVPV